MAGTVLVVGLDELDAGALDLGEVVVMPKWYRVALPAPGLAPWERRSPLARGWRSVSARGWPSVSARDCPRLCPGLARGPELASTAYDWPECHRLPALARLTQEAQVKESPVQVGPATQRRPEQRRPEPVRPEPLRPEPLRLGPLRPEPLLPGPGCTEPKGNLCRAEVPSPELEQQPSP